ncbi:hypothetical protein HU200_016250 [Digitaria exilis]|uniref:Uncharacterized protein n=1 Tax=Digitaria exilis TaxID=1010633 RepID=A0A835FA82_9POAL|nr:hypothetical protein HU200_016250 [Digitaria exilis]
MALHSPCCSTRRWARGPRDLSLACSPPPTAEGGSSSGAYADGARKAKEDVHHLLAKLEKQGVEIDDKIACIIDDGMARIKAETERENIHKPLGVWMEVLLIFLPGAIGFFMGVQRMQKAFREELSKRGYVLSK